MTDPGSPLPPPTPIPTGEPHTPWWKNWWVIAIPIVALVVAIAVAVGGGGDGDGDGTEDGDGVDTTVTTGETPPGTETPTTEVPSTTEVPPTTEIPSTTEVTQTTEVSPTTEIPSTTEAAATTVPLDDSEPTCGYLGTDSFNDIQVELLLTNRLGAVPALDVTIALKGGDGVRFLTDTQFVQYPLPEERFRLEVDTVTELPAGVDEATISCEVLAVEEGFGDLPELPGPGDVCEFVEIDDFGDIQIEITATSPFTTTGDLFVHYALRGPGGVRFSDSSALVDLVGAGETIRVSEDTVTEPPSWVGDEISCDILGFEAF